jgi:hypothetical protein
MTREASQCVVVTPGDDEGSKPMRQRTRVATTVAAALLGLAACASENPAPAPVDPARLQAASDLEVGRSYLETEYTLASLELVKQGADLEIATPGGLQTITPENVGQVEPAYRERLEAYAGEIERRGQPSLKGAWFASANDRCLKLPSGLVLVAATAGAVDRPPGVSVSPRLVLTQDGLEFRLVQLLSAEGESATLAYRGVTVGDSVVLRDAINPELHFVGRIEDELVQLRPDVEALRRTPTPVWVPQPDWQAMEECSVLLNRAP